MRHNPYFSGNLFAIGVLRLNGKFIPSHNPYFSGNLFAIFLGDIMASILEVTILILVETSLQSIYYQI